VFPRISHSVNREDPDFTLSSPSHGLPLSLPSLPPFLALPPPQRAPKDTLASKDSLSHITTVYLTSSCYQALLLRSNDFSVHPQPRQRYALCPHSLPFTFDFRLSALASCFDLARCCCCCRQFPDPALNHGVAQSIPHVCPAIAVDAKLYL
jgi:hypothetical protein